MIKELGMKRITNYFSRQILDKEQMNKMYNCKIITKEFVPLHISY